MNQNVVPFDDSFDARAVLPEAERRTLEEMLSRLCGRDTRLTYERHSPEDVEVSHDLETVAWVGCEDPALATTMADIVSRFCGNQARYLMASRMHKRVVDLDYEELKKKNADLEASRSRYKALSESLEERVEEQVRRIETAQRQVYLRERLSTIGQLAAGMAHEINNPLGYIINNLRAGMGYVEDLSGDAVAEAERADVLDDFSSLLRESLEGADRVSVIVGDLKRFADIDNASPARTVNLVELVESALRMTAAVHPHAHGLCHLDCPERVDFNGHAGHLSQAILNILDNAVLACDDTGRVDVALMETGEDIRITVSDTGCGMDPEQRERAFEPFFTTRKVGDGAGLGLSSARDIICAHQGEIRLESAPGEGTSVAITLPLTEGAR